MNDHRPSSPPVIDYRTTTNVAMPPKGLRKDCVLFFTEDFRDLAHRIAGASQGQIELGSIRWK